ncbi:hypothetical protein ACFL35_01690 [Candidatus Riflebacteria bacterium]
MVENFGAAGVKARYIFSITFFIPGLLMAIYFFYHNSPYTHRVLLFLPFFLASLGFFQARAKT